MAHDKLAKAFPRFKFRGFLMDIRGNVIELKIEDRPKIDSSKVKEDKFLVNLQH
jgi:hypothetical protein